MIKKFVKFYKNLFLDKNENFYINKTFKPSSYKKKIKSQKKNNILLVLPSDHYYVCYYHSIYQDRLSNFNLYGYWPYSIHVKRKRIFQNFHQIKSNIYFYFLKKKFSKLYSFLDLKFFDTLQTLKNKFISKKEEENLKHKCEVIFKNIKNKKEILKIKIKGIECGDLIYDTYIRFRNQPTVDKEDEFLKSIIFISLLQIECFKKMQSIYRFKKIYTSYATYIHYGILVRFFLNEDVEVYSGHTLSQYNKKITKTDQYHVENYKKFKKNFLLQKKKLEKLKEGQKLIKNIFYNNRKNLEFRDYMKIDPYRSVNNNVKKNYDGIVFLPNFFESQREWGKLIFIDFYEWINYTLNLIEKYNLNIAVKPHPNTYFVGTESIQVVEDLKKKFPNVDWINPMASNKSIFKKIKFGISPWGTVLWEMAYFNVIPISAGDHPACKYHFGFEPRSVKSYKNLIVNSKKLSMKFIDIKKIYEFCYMYYLHDNDHFKSEARKIKLNQIDFTTTECLKIYLTKINK